MMEMDWNGIWLLRNVLRHALLKLQFERRIVSFYLSGARAFGECAHVDEFICGWVKFILHCLSSFLVGDILIQ